MTNDFPPLNRRALLQMVGLAAGGSAMLGAMTTLGHANPSPYKGPIKLEGAPSGQKVLVLGAGVAGMTAALELRKAGYEVQILEYQKRAGGRCWTLKGGDEVEELGFNTQKVEFSDGHYINIGPWRIPHHHRAVLDYCTRLGVDLEVFVQKNENAYLHSSDAFGGKPQRYSHISADWMGQTSELLAKAVNGNALGDAVSIEDREMLLEALKSYGVLDKNYRYVASLDTAGYRGYPDGQAPGGGLYDAAPQPSDPIGLSDIVSSRLWQQLRTHNTYNHHAPMFQPVGGMEKIADAFKREVGDLITYNAKVTAIRQDTFGVTVDWRPADGSGDGGQVTADWCVCTIPFNILSQMEADFSAGHRAVMADLLYHESVKSGLEMKRRFWETDEQIYGGVTYTDMPIAEISYPSYKMFSDGPGVLLGCYVYGPEAYILNSMSPAERLEVVLDQGARIHPQYRDEFANGVVVSWHRVPWMMGCYSNWTDRKAQNYDLAATIDRRIVCAGEHLSYIPGWQEGSILSALDAIRQVHDRALENRVSAPTKPEVTP
jgi:monoamine oxidase